MSRIGRVAFPSPTPSLPATLKCLITLSSYLSIFSRYLGFSWASGVVTLMGTPYPNGRNEESSSEAISAYEAVALYGEVSASIYRDDIDIDGRVYYDNSLRLRDMGRLLLATEIRSAKTFWHVQSPGAPGVSRIYPEAYTPKVVGMLWSMLAQEQVMWESILLSLLSMYEFPPFLTLHLSASVSLLSIPLSACLSLFLLYSLTASLSFIFP